MGAKTWAALSFCIVSVFLASALFLSCGNNGSATNPSSPNNPGNPPNPGGNAQPIVSVTLSDPAVCSASHGGPFQHIYVTISDVQMFASASLPLQNGIDLTPNLSQSPMQVDLLGSPGPNCILATLGSAASVPPGSYHALQVSLAGTDQVSKIQGGGKCPNTPSGPAANCMVLANGSAVSFDSATTGSSQFDANIAGGAITTSSGTQVLNVDFDSCASVLFVYTGEYGMDPTFRAALMPTAGSITGKLLDASTQQPIAGDVIVALEQVDSNGVDREIMQTAPATDGSFVLCPVPPGTYDVVAAAVSESGISYVTTITTHVQPGDSLGSVSLQAVSGANQAVAALAGQVTATGPMPPLGGYTHVVVSALQSISVNGGTVLVTIPLPGQYTSALRTFVTDTANYELHVPSGEPLVGVFAANGRTKYQQGATPPATYRVDVQSSCNPATEQTSAVTVSGGSTSAVPTVGLVGCPAA